MKTLTEQWNEVTEELFQEALKHTDNRDRAWQATISTIEKILFSSSVDGDDGDFESLISDEEGENTFLTKIKKEEV